ncbi:uncharacterized protein LOC112466070 [Temnothorax curvispinosus]|uniref:Uncharacterized protein LOC112466070 n=1 Tax=Temnothorax curvispinosus TaxID=300111 RepID=A0A6J1R532_9HYME|nr:uncharacterized protein LOC112466070 [Temnothorax curvispinosus]
MESRITIILLFIIIRYISGMKEKEYTVTGLKDNPGIFFEAVGEMRTSENSWKMIIYIDLRDIKGATAKLEQQMDSILQQCGDHNSHCEIRPRLTSLIAKLNKIKQYQDHIRALIGESRTKRAPLEFVGQLSKILFGTLTIEDEYAMRNAIMHVENKTNDLALLLVNQTVATRARFGELYNATWEIRKQLSAIEIKAMLNQRHRYFWEVMTKLDTEILQHEIDLNILIDGILFGKQGFIHPRLISPQQLIENCKLIKEQNPHAEFPNILE